MHLHTACADREIVGLTADDGSALRIVDAWQNRCRRKRTCAANTDGFTFVELVLILGIIAVLVTIALPMYQSYRDKVRTAQAGVDISGLAAEIKQYGDDHRLYPATLADIGRATMRDPWGNVYQYLSHDDVNGNGGFRKDKNIVPINSDFDLYSMGPDGASVPPLTAKVSRDDIVRANDGAFVGLVSEYDP
jgi:general secretion pathway protein G